MISEYNFFKASPHIYDAIYTSIRVHILYCVIHDTVHFENILTAEGRPRGRAGRDAVRNRTERGSYLLVHK